MGNQRKSVGAVAIGQTLFWASSFYVFHAMLPRWEAFYGWSRVEVAGGLTAALLSAAVSAPFAGTLIDRNRGRLGMVTGGIVASLCLILLTKVTALYQFYMIWILLGVCHATILYEPCFAMLTHCYGQNAKRAITMVTLIAGFAGTICFPAAHFLSEQFDWQTTLWIFSAFCLLGTLVSWSSFHTIESQNLVVPDTQRDQNINLTRSKHHNTTDSTTDSTTRKIVTSRDFWLVTMAFSLVMLTHGFLLAHLVPLMLERKHSLGNAVLVLSLIGPMQVIGRILMLTVQDKLPTHLIALISFLAIACACLMLLFAQDQFWLAIVFVCLYGAGYGVISIARPTVTAQFFGSGSFGAVSGIMSVPFTTCFALAPALAAILWIQWGYDVLLAGSIFLSILSVGLIYGAGKSRHVAQKP